MPWKGNARPGFAFVAAGESAADGAGDGDAAARFPNAGGTRRTMTVERTVQAEKILFILVSGYV
jgi:hypothetical protein